MNNGSSDSTRTDAVLLGDVRDPRNHAAWEKFIARYGPMIRGWCCQWFRARLMTRSTTCYPS